MGLLRADDLKLAETISRLDYCNPFLPERVVLERDALGPEFVGFEQFLHVDARQGLELEANVERIMSKLAELLERARSKLTQGAAANEKERGLYEDVALFWLYHRFHLPFRRWIAKRLDGQGGTRVDFWPEFEEHAKRLLRVPGVTLPHGEPLEHLFSFFGQLNRAFVNIYVFLVGGALAAAELRGAIWQSIFTHDLKRYRRVLYDKMSDIATLVVGPSGTGKELVARAIGLSRYIPFEARTRSFAEDFVESFHALNLSALSPTLIESELFGHRRGAFTGALADRPGWFESCSALGSVFLDEIGDLDPAIQVKLLRVLQTRSYQRLGDTATRVFRGKLIAATNRDLAAAMQDGAFREDLYYRLCSDLVVTPSLKRLTGGDLDELKKLVSHVAQRVAGQEGEALTAEVIDWIERELGADYDWPGNFRELEQCVRNVLIRKEYRPTTGASRDSGIGALAESGTLTADEMLTRYVRHVHARTGNISETARRLGLDRRTVRARVKDDRSSA